MKGRYQFSVRTLLFLITWASAFLAVMLRFPQDSVAFVVAMTAVWLGMGMSGIALVKWEEKREAADEEREE